MADLSKFYERAEKALLKGKPAQALEAYEDAIEVDPHDARAVENAADLSNTLGDTERATELLRTLFEDYLEKEASTRLIPVYKKYSRLTTVSREQLRRYAQLIENLNRREAMDAYELSLSRAKEVGDEKTALEILNRLVALEPSTELYQRLAEQAAACGDHKLAAGAYIQLAMALEHTHSDAAMAYEKAYKEDPKNLAACFGYGKALLVKGQYELSIQLLTPLACYPSAPIEAREPYVQALLKAGRVLETAGSLWELYELHPEQYGSALTQLMGAQVLHEQSTKAVALARKLEVTERRAGRRRQFLQDMQAIAATVPTDTVFLQYMAELYDAANMETEHNAVLSLLFELNLAQGKYAQALRALENWVDICTWDPGHKQRLQQLIGKVDTEHLGLVASRLGIPLDEDLPETDEAVVQDFGVVTEPVIDLSRGKKTPVAGERQESVKYGIPEELEKLLLDAEISLQYGLTQKASELGQQILRQHPSAAGVERVRELFISLGQPLHQNATPEAGASGQTGMSLELAAGLNGLIARQATPEAVVSTAVREICMLWQARRVVLAFCAPLRPPSLLREHCSDGVEATPIPPLVELLGQMQSLCLQNGGHVFLNHGMVTQKLSGAAALLADGWKGTLLGVPLTDGDRSAGIMLLESGGSVSWRQDELAMLQSVLAQTVLAVNNARLRQLVRKLAVAEEGSGLMKRSSYLDLLLSEAERVNTQHSFLSLMLLQIGSSSLPRKLGESMLQRLMQQAGQLLTSHLRQNDVAVHYAPAQVVLLLPNTQAQNAMLAFEKLRKVLVNLHVEGYDKPFRLWAGIAEVNEMSGFDAADIVTEAINRLEQALWLARTASQDGVFHLPRPTVTVAV